jgi:transposase
MVTDRQVRRLMMELGTGTPLSTAAMRAGMSENTARRYRTGPLPSQRKAPRQYRTRPDPLAAVWPEIEALLVQAPGLEATTIFETLRGRPEGPLTDGQLRTLQRRIRRWRATHGPEREVMFPQIHRPGEYAQSDFTAMGALGITLNGQPFDHLFYHFVLPYSNWETGALCVSESFEALIAGFQAAVWELGRVPALHRTDNLSAATHDLREGGRTFNERYRQVLDHYGVRPDANMPGRGHENGDVEQAHHRFKRAVEQALLLRGQRDFDSQAHYAQFLRAILAGRNRGRQAALQDELPHMHALPSSRLEDFRVLRVVVNRFSMIRVGHNVYSVASRLIGETVEVRVYPERLEVRYAGEGVATIDRLRGRGQAAIDYRHLIGSLVRKPGAFARYRYQATLFPTTTFRRASDALTACQGSRADVEYVRLLQLAARTSECEVETVLGRLLDGGTLRDSAQVKAVVQPERIAVPACVLTPPDLTVYDACLATAGGVQ